MTQSPPPHAPSPHDLPIPQSHWLPLPEPPVPLDWRSVFGRNAPVELEIGCGNGRHLALAAPANPDHDFLGIEVARQYALLAAQRLAKYEITNARAAHAEALEFLQRRVPSGSLAAVHIYFSDPWPKRRHARRRLFQRRLLDALALAVSPGASVHVKTDVDWYYARIVSLFLGHPACRIESYGEQTEFPSEDLEMTGFESKAQRLQRRVFFLHARRV